MRPCYPGRTLSAVRSKVLKRGIALGLLTLGTVVMAESCGFPDHTFVDDSVFYGKGKKDAGSGGNATSGADASAGGSGAAGFAGSSGGGLGGGGVFGEGGTTAGKREGGVRRMDAGSGGSGGGEAVEAGAGAGAMDSGPHCGVGLTDCSGACVDLLSDKNNCGDCDARCTGSDVCTTHEADGGTKTACAPPCAGTLKLCVPTGTTTGVCVDTTSDENNCQDCNRPCPAGFVCEGSQCLVDCHGLTRCDGQCVDTSSNDQYCGNCSTNCKTSSEVCAGGNCEASCSFPFIACGTGASSTCVNPTNDNQNCNGCGKPCASGYACVNSACKKLVENCQNGVDDDGDNLVDCADPDCTAGYTCGTTPAGWNGPIALWSGAAGTDPSCGAAGGFPGNAFVANSGLVVPPPGNACPACGCTTAPSSYCDDLTFIFDTSKTCTNQSPWNPQPFAPNTSTTECQTFGLCEATPSAESALLEKAPGAYVHGSCTATQGTPAFPSTSWTTDVVGCSTSVTTGGGCSSGGLCVPKPAAPFGAPLCIWRSGIQTCPSDYPTEEPGPAEQYYQGVTEGRSCTACSCSVGCGGTITTYTDNACTAGATTLDFSKVNACTEVPADPTQIFSSAGCGGVKTEQDTRSYKYLNAGPVCTATASNPQGQPSPTGPVTVCCQATP